VRLNFFTYLHPTPTPTPKKKKKKEEEEEEEEEKEQNANAHFLVVTELLEVHGFGTISEACQTQAFSYLFFIWKPITFIIHLKSVVKAWFY